MTAFADLDTYYARRRRQEVDYGSGWRYEGDVYRVAWVVATGELIAVRQGPPPRRGRIRIARHPYALAVLGGEPMGVYVLGRIADRAEVERRLAGWQDMREQPDSLAWAIARLDLHMGAAC